MNANNEVVKQTYTNSDGLFSYDNLEETTYSLWVDKAGILNNLAPAISLEEDNIQDDLKFKLHKTYLEDITTVSIKNIEESNFEIYPNPTNKFLTIINKDFNKNFKVEIINILGKKVYSKNSNSKELKINMVKQGFSKGTYFIKLSTEEGSYFTKIVFE